jgi:hypothetical protein
MEEITMADTHLGRQEETMKKELLITGANMTDEEWSSFFVLRQKKVDDRNHPQQQQAANLRCWQRIRERISIE